MFVSKTAKRKRRREMINNTEKSVLLFIVITVCAIWSIAILVFIIRINSDMSKVIERGMFAYGYHEKEGVWNRIRVDEKGHVYCAGEKQ
jgi:hypothetical protein